MKKLNKITLIALLISLLSGCSYLNELKIFNLSDSAITIKYTLSSEIGGYFDKLPKVYKLDNKGEPDFDNANQSSVTSDSSLNITILLDTGYVLIMGNIRNQLNPELLKHDPKFNLDEFSIKYKEDYLSAKGSFIPFMFKTDGKFQFGLTIK